ncbi:transposase [Dyadobacter sp. OTU695]|uniref:transposase n=1 Tax=Dyadobacter sp. OTU695 TaxID=3043860 RepID=UPI00313CFCA7
MGNSYSQIFIQCVFAVKYRAARLHKSWRQELFGVIGNLINEAGARTLIVNGVEDHVHCLFTLRSAQSVAEVMKVAKAKSSKWIHESGFLKSRFEWQVGYGAFSYSKSEIKRVYRYIENQEEHHCGISFPEEYLDMLVKNGIEFQEQYLFHAPV